MTKRLEVNVTEGTNNQGATLSVHHHLYSSMRRNGNNWETPVSREDLVGLYDTLVATLNQIGIGPNDPLVGNRWPRLNRQTEPAPEAGRRAIQLGDGVMDVQPVAPAPAPTPRERVVTDREARRGDWIRFSAGTCSHEDSIDKFKDTTPGKLYRVTHTGTTYVAYVDDVGDGVSTGGPYEIVEIIEGQVAPAPAIDPRFPAEPAVGGLVTCLHDGIDLRRRVNYEIVAVTHPDVVHVYDDNGDFRSLTLGEHVQFPATPGLPEVTGFTQTPEAGDRVIAHVTEVDVVKDREYEVLDMDGDTAYVRDDVGDRYPLTRGQYRFYGRAGRQAPEPQYVPITSPVVGCVVRSRVTEFDVVAGRDYTVVSLYGDEDGDVFVRDDAGGDYAMEMGDWENPRILSTEVEESAPAAAPPAEPSPWRVVNRDPVVGDHVRITRVPQGETVFSVGQIVVAATADREGTPSIDCVEDMSRWVWLIDPNSRQVAESWVCGEIVERVAQTPPQNIPQVSTPIQGVARETFRQFFIEHMEEFNRELASHAGQIVSEDDLWVITLRRMRGEG